MSIASQPAPGFGFRDLECFLVLVEELHFGRAAQRLGVTQSSLAAMVRRLESEIDVPLVTRRSPSIKATDAGLRFAEQARALLGGLELATAEARRAANVRVPLRTGCVPDLPLGRLQGFLGGLYAQRPLLDVDLAFLSTREQIAGLRRGELDLGIIRHARESAGIDVEPLFDGEPLAAFVAPGHPLDGKAAVRPGDLAGEVLIAPPRDADPALDDHVTAVLAAGGHGFPTVRRIAGRDARSMLFAVADQHGVAIAPASTLHALGDIARLVSCVPFEPALHLPDAALAWRADPPAGLRSLVSFARGVASMLYTSQQLER